MKDEIEEIINDLQRVADRKCYPEDILDGSIAQEWVDYITNLQARNEKAIEYIYEHREEALFEDNNGKLVYALSDNFDEGDLLNILRGEANIPENLYKYTPEKGFRLVGDE